MLNEWRGMEKRGRGKFIQTIGEHWLWMLGRNPMKISPSHRLARLLSHCYLFHEAREVFYSSNFHKASTAWSSSSFSRKDSVDHPEMDSSTLNDSYFVFLFLEFSPGHFTDTRRQPLCVTLAINLDFVCLCGAFAARGIQSSWEHQLWILSEQDLLAATHGHV